MYRTFPHVYSNEIIICLQKLRTDVVLSTGETNTLKCVDRYCISGEKLILLVGKYC